MAEIDFESEVDISLSCGLINEYAAGKLLAMVKDGLTEDLWQGAIDHYREASDAGVSNDKDFAMFFYIDLFADDLLYDILGTKLSDDERSEFKRFLFQNRKRLNLTSIESFKNAAREWADGADSLDKRAYPNTGNIVAAESAYDLNKWAHLFVQIQNMIRTGLGADVAMTRMASSLSIPEKYKFLIWANYNMKSEFKKYDVNHEIRARENLLRREAPMRNKIASDGQYYYVPKFITRPEQPLDTPVMPAHDQDSGYDDQYAIDFEAARNKLMSRVFAIDKLLEKYRKVIKPEQVEAVEEALSELRKRVRKLRLASSVKDSLIKTANILNKLEFSDGAQELLAIAADEDLAQPAGTTRVVEREFKSVPPEQREGALDDAVKRLTDISSVLKNRDLIRSLAEIDLMLHKLRMSSFFPEIQEAQSKLIDAFGYASNKVEDLLPKLRGGLQTQPDIVSEQAPEAGSASSEQKQLGDEVREMAADIKKAPSRKTAPSPAAAPAPAPVAKPSPEDDEGFEDEPVNLRSIPGLE